MTLWWPNPDDVQSWLAQNGYFSRDWGLLSSALGRPLATFHGEEVYPSLWLKLAALLDSIQRNHPLLDGNKRLGYLLTALILQGNGISADHVTDDQWYEVVLDVASGHADLEDLAARLQRMLDAP